MLLNFILPDYCFYCSSNPDVTSGEPRTIGKAFVTRKKYGCVSYYLHAIMYSNVSCIKMFEEGDHQNLQGKEKINIERMSKGQWMEVWNSLPRLIIDKNQALLEEWGIYLQGKPPIDEVRMKRLSSGLLVAKCSTNDIWNPRRYLVSHKIESYKMSGPSVDVVESYLFPALYYSLLTDGRLLIIGDDHLGATHIRLATQLGVLSESDFPFVAINIDEHKDDGYFGSSEFAREQVSLEIALKEYKSWVKICQGVGALPKDFLKIGWCNSDASLQRLAQQYAKQKVAVTFVDLDSLIPSIHDYNSDGGVIDWGKSRKNLAGLFRQSSVISISTSTGDFSDQSSVPRVLKQLGTLLSQF